MRRTVALLACLAAAPDVARDNTPLPKLGDIATRLTEATGSLQQSPAPPGGCAFSTFVRPQCTASACSIATVTPSGQRALRPPALAEDTV